MTDSELKEILKEILPEVEKRIEEVKPYVRDYYLINLENFAKDISKDTIRTVSEYPYGDISLLDSLMDDAGQLYLFVLEKVAEEYITNHNICASIEDINWISEEGWEDAYLKIHDDIVWGETLFELDFDMSIEEAIKHEVDLPDNALYDEFSKSYFHEPKTEK